MANKISLSDVGLVVQIIDNCSLRGAFKGEELAEIGLLRTRMIEYYQKELEEKSKENTK